MQNFSGFSTYKKANILSILFKKRYFFTTILKVKKYMGILYFFTTILKGTFRQVLPTFSAYKYLLIKNYANIKKVNLKK